MIKAALYVFSFSVLHVCHLQYIAEFVLALNTPLTFCIQILLMNYWEIYKGVRCVCLYMSCNAFVSF